MRKHDIDLQTAMSLGDTKREVAVTTAAFLIHLMNAIVEHQEVYIEGFGRFRLSHQRGSRARIETLHTGNFRSGESTGSIRVAVDKKYTVTFSKAAPFKEKIRRKYGKSPVVEEVMEKYGVDESVDAEKLEKQAAAGCPACGKDLVKHGKVLMCPEHGSEPFEKK